MAQPGPSFIPVLDQYTCALGTAENPVNLNAGLTWTDGWTIGFWIKIQSITISNLSFLKVASTTALQDEVHTVSNFSADVFSLYVDGEFNFSFAGSSNFDDLNIGANMRNGASNWNYFAYSYKNIGGSVNIIRSKNGESGHLKTSSALYEPQNTYLVVGYSAAGSGCLFPFKIESLVIFDGAYDLSYGAEMSPLSLASRGRGVYLAVYKLNWNSFARNFLNLLDNSKFKATLTNPVKLKPTSHSQNTVCNC